jgi:hypothetical protein
LRVQGQSYFYTVVKNVLCMVTTDAVSPAEVHAVWNEIWKGSYELMWAEEFLCYSEVIPWKLPFHNCERYGQCHSGFLPNILPNTPA